MDDSAIAAMAAALRELGEEFDPSAGFAVVPLTDCPHLSDLPAREVSMDARCSQCLEDEVWICGTCGKVLCSRYKNKHMLEHAEQEGHAIGLSLSDLSFWCFKCNSLDVFALPKLHALYTAHVAKFGQPPSQAPHPLEARAQAPDSKRLRGHGVAAWPWNAHKGPCPIQALFERPGAQGAVRLHRKAASHGASSPVECLH